MDVNELTCIPIAEIEGAKDRLKGKVLRTPLVPLNYEDDDRKIYLKLENLQPVGSFKIRGACNIIQQLTSNDLQHGVFTASAGNFAQGLAWNAKQLSLACNIIVPDTAPQTKLDAIKRYNGKIVKVPYDTWWSVMENHTYEGMLGKFVHPFADRRVIAGNGTIGLEILEDLADVDAVIVPYGGGGLSTGVGSVFKKKSPQTKVFACEVDTAAPLKTSLNAGKPSVVANHKPSFVDGMGGKLLFPEMWNLAKNVITDSIPLGLQDIAHAVKILLERNHIVAEGAGAATVAAAMSGQAGTGNIVCVISGGNIDTNRLISILNGNIPL